MAKADSATKYSPFFAICFFSNSDFGNFLGLPTNLDSRMYQNLNLRLNLQIMALTFQNKDASDALQPGGFFPKLEGFSKIVVRVICISSRRIIDWENTFDGKFPILGQTMQYMGIGHCGTGFFGTLCILGWTVRHTIA